MSQQKNGPIILSACFGLFALLFGVMWYMSSSDADGLRTELDSARGEKTNLDGTIRKLNADIDTLKAVIGRDGEAASIQESVNTELQSPRISDGTEAATSMNTALTRSLSERDTQRVAANSRQADLQLKILELNRTVESKNAEIQVAKDGLAEAEKNLRKKEAEHSEQLQTVTTKFNDMRDSLQALQEEHDNLKVETQRTVELLEDDIRDKRAALVQMRTRIFQQEDLSFDKPDGVIRSVDHVRELAYINLGKDDALQVGTSFSVYKANNSGVGRRDTEDIKAGIVVVDIIGPHLAECRITSQKRPISEGDPIYNPVFSPGLKVEIALTGLIDFDGDSKSDRGLLLDLIHAADANVVVQVADEGQFIDEHNKPLSQEEAEDKITERTRFLVVADLGEISVDSQDSARRAIYQRIQKNTNRLREAALEHGVYVVSLSNFLEFIGYTRKLQVYRPGSEFPGTLANGARSSSVNSAFGNRESAGTTSARFSGRRRPNTQSTGNVSKLYE